MRGSFTPFIGITFNETTCLNSLVQALRSLSLRNFSL